MGGSREKWRSFERKSACIFEWSGGGREKPPSFLFSTSAKVEFRVLWSENLPIKLIFSAQNEISGENFSRAEEKKPRKRWILPQKWPNRAKKGGFGEEITGRG